MVIKCVKRGTNGTKVREKRQGLWHKGFRVAVQAKAALFGDQRFWAGAPHRGSSGGDVDKLRQALGIMPPALGVGEDFIGFHDVLEGRGALGTDAVGVIEFSQLSVGMQNIPVCRRTWDAEDEGIVFQFHTSTSWAVRGAQRRAGHRSPASRRAHGLGQGMVWAVPLRIAAGLQAVRTGAQTGKHLSHNYDKEPLAYIHMPYKIKGLSRFSCACGRFLLSLSFLSSLLFRIWRGK